MKKLIAVLGTVALMGIGATAAIASEGDAGIGDAVTTDCVTVIDVPEQTIHHDAITHEVTVIDQEAVAGFWANFAPNNVQGEYTGTPSFPTDAAGTWIIHDNDGGPAGGPGVFFVSHGGSGNGDWFYRQPAVEEVSHVETVVDQEAYDEVIPAVTHEDCTTTTVDVCPNIADVQEEVPAGYALEDGKCIKEENAPPGTVQDTPTNGGPRVAPVKPTTQAPVLPDTE